MFCPNCGKEISEKASICINCGESLKPQIVRPNNRFIETETIKKEERPINHTNDENIKNNTGGVGLMKYVTKKTLKFGITGAVGAACGSVISDGFMDQGSDSALGTVGSVAFWVGIIGIGTTIALQMLQNNYLRKPLFSASMLKTSILVLLLGGFAGGLAQVIFGLTSNISETVEIISRILCWGLAGLGIGWGVATFVPNFPKTRALLAGFLGGCIGGAIFRFTFNIFPESYGRIIGVATLGFFIGLMISFVEEALREAWLTVVWADNKTTSVALGKKEIILGSSSKADIHLPAEKNYPKIAAVIEFKNSQIFIDNKIDNQRTELKQGSKITIGEIEITVNMDRRKMLR